MSSVQVIGLCTSSTLFLIAQRTATSGHSIWTFSSTVVLLQTLWLCVNQMHVVVSLGNALHVGSKSCLYEFTELNFLSVGSQLPPRTLNILIDWLIEFARLFAWVSKSCAISLASLHQQSHERDCNSRRCEWRISYNRKTQNDSAFCAEATKDVCRQSPWIWKASDQYMTILFQFIPLYRCQSEVWLASV